MEISNIDRLILIITLIDQCGKGDLYLPVALRYELGFPTSHAASAL